jgi:hypothetical protein
MAVMPTDGDNRIASLLLDADSLYRQAWLIRGTEPAIGVVTDQRADFDTRITQAEAKLLEARELAPTCPEIPRLMICIENIQGRGRDRMEMWFDRAMHINGDDYFACLAKLEYLEPRWHGSEAEMLGFGRACLKTENWEGRLPFILIEAHLRLAKTSLAAVPNTPYEVSYYSRPYVWNDIQAVYEPHLARHPDSHYDKTCYAKLAAFGGHFELADRLFDELGNNYWRSLFQGDQYSRLRAVIRQRKGGAAIPAQRQGQRNALKLGAPPAGVADPTAGPGS